MKSLQTLIRLQKREIDSQRAIVVALETEIAAVEGAIQALFHEVARERDAVREQIATSMSLAAYLKNARIRENGFRQKLAMLKKSLEAERALLQQLFEAMKRYEIALEQRMAAEAAEQARQEQMMLDEIGIEQFRRAGKERDGDK